MRDLYDFKSLTGRGAAELRHWLLDQAFHATSNLDLAERLVARCRETQIILPGISTIERLCAEMLVAAERQIDAVIADRLDDRTRRRLDALLDDMITDQLTRFVWLRQFDVGNNSRAANQLLDRLKRLQKLDLPTDLLADIPLHKIKRLHRHGERYFADALRDLSDDRRYAIMGVCALEWQAAISVAVVETPYGRFGSAKSPAGQGMIGSWDVHGAKPNGWLTPGLMMPRPASETRSCLSRIWARLFWRRMVTINRLSQ